MIQVLVQFLKINNRHRQIFAVAGQGDRQRFQFQAVDGGHRKAFIKQIMAHRVTRRPQTSHQHIFAVVGQHGRTFDVQRIPAGQQAVYFKTVGHEQYIGQHIGFNLRNIDRIGFLIDAAFHALVADAMPGARTHGIVDNNNRQSANVVAIAFDPMHFRNFFIQGTTDCGHAQWINFEGIGFFVAHAFGTGIVIALMAIYTVIDF